MNALLHRFVVMLFLFTATAGFAATSPDTAGFDAANRLYDQGKFLEAAAGYQKIADTGPVSPALYFNLGNALFKSGQVGRAITAYARAEQLAPRDPDLRANLQFARNQVQGPTARPDFWERQLTTLTLNEWTWLVVVAVWLTFLLLAVGQLKPVLKGALRLWAVATGGVAILLGVCLGFAVQEHLSGGTAIVTVQELVIRTGPFEEAQSAFTAHDGAELRVLDRKDDWYQVTDGAGRIGWLRQGNVQFAARS